MNKNMPSCLLGVALLSFAAMTNATVMKAMIGPLADVLRYTHGQSGVSFVVPPCLQNDVLSREIPGLLTAAALAELLEGYNYGAEWDVEGRLVRVIVSGRVGEPGTECSEDDGGESTAVTRYRRPPAEQLLFYEPMPAEMPERYRQMPSGAVNPISVPTEQLNRMELGERLDMTLPDGQYGVILESRFEHDNGDVTWVGYLEGLDSSDRVIITGGHEGSVGQVITPGSTYSIEFDAGRSWLVDIGRPDLQATLDTIVAEDSLLP